MTDSEYARLSAETVMGWHQEGVVWVRADGSYTGHLVYDGAMDYHAMWNPRQDERNAVVLANAWIAGKGGRYVCVGLGSDGVSCEIGGMDVGERIELIRADMQTAICDAIYAAVTDGKL